MERPFLLLTNDDGITAAGLRTLWESIHEIADVAIVAPQSEKSGCGLSITWGSPLMIHSVEWENKTKAWTINGTPADCVKMALAVLLERRPQMILSGINRGSNAGRTVLYSGTVGGVIEGAMKGIPGIAFSFSDYDVSPPASFVKQQIISIVKHFIEKPLPPETVANVNFPLMEKGIKGLRFAIQGKGYWAEQPERRVHPEGVPYYWLGGRWHSFPETPGSDIALLEEGYTTIVPLQVGHLTHHEAITIHKSHLESESEMDQITSAKIDAKV